jgi:tetratricopeptide (TPR) repeat protein
MRYCAVVIARIGYPNMNGLSAVSRRIAAIVATTIVGIVLAAPAHGGEQVDRAFEQAKGALRQGNDDTAIGRLDEAVRLEPKRAKYRGLRGVAWLRKGEYAKGAADLKAAIELNPEDAGQRYRPSPEIRLSAAALRHGQRQVAQILHDRPGMAQFGPESEFLCRWAERKFAGEDLGTRIDWDPSPPQHSDAEHLAPAGDEHAAILVAADYQSGPKQGRPRGFEELWAGAIYELHNVTFAPQFVRLNGEADEGKVTKRAFVAGILGYEIRAAQQTRAFYLHVFLPWAEKKKLPTDPTLWFCDWWDTPEEVLQSVKDQAAYPWQPYARTHDWATVHRSWHQGRIRRALRLLEQMRAEKGYQEDEEDVQYWIDRCRERLGKQAVAEAGQHTPPTRKPTKAEPKTDPPARAGENK